MASLTGISQVLVLGFGELAAPVSARHFSISVSTCHRPVRLTEETGSQSASGPMQFGKRLFEEFDAPLLLGPRIW